MLQLGSIALGERPRIVVALRDKVAIEEVDAVLNAGAEILEFRIDAFSSQDPDYVCRELARFNGRPRLATIRAPWEKGGWSSDEDTRLALYEAILEHAEAVDIELSSTQIAEQVLAAAHAQGLLTIASFHDFEKTPDWDYLEGLIRAAEASGAAILKVASQADSQEDVQRLARLTLARPELPKIVIGMGAMAKLSRVFFPALGSLMTYTFLGEPTAPGQLTCEELLDYRKIFYDAS